jgi:CheY-like chemotaxis protein
MTNNITLGLDAPMLLLVCDRNDSEALSEPLLATAGWRVTRAQSGRDAGLLAAQVPVSLVLLALEESRACASAADTIRTAPGASAAAPILVLGQTSGTNDDPNWTGVDTVLPPTLAPEALLQRLESWRPVSVESTRRIAAMFGSGPIAGMIERLARRLEAAIAGLDRGIVDKAEAHRLAGLCGTLGFGQAHAAWLDLSLGDESSVDEVRRTTRLTLAAIARGV